jgi:hypothetical protein
MHCLVYGVVFPVRTSGGNPSFQPSADPQRTAAYRSAFPLDAVLRCQPTLNDRRNFTCLYALDHYAFVKLSRGRPVSTCQS